MVFQPFEDLKIFQLAEQLSDEIWKIVKRWGAFEKDTVGKQWVKAADSVGANIAEGSGRGSKRDNQRFIRISRGSLNETKFWLRRATKRNLIEDKQRRHLNDIIDNLSPALNAFLKSMND